MTHGEVDIWRRVYATIWCDCQDAEEASRLANQAITDLRALNERINQKRGPPKEGYVYMSQAAVTDV